MRSRFADYVPTNAAVRLTQDDIRLFQLLQDIPYLALPYIGELLGHNAALVERKGRLIVRYEYLRQPLRRLRKDGGYLQVPAASWPRKGDIDRPAVYQLEAAVFELLERTIIKFKDLRVRVEPMPRLLNQRLVDLGSLVRRRRSHSPEESAGATLYRKVPCDT